MTTRAMALRCLLALAAVASSSGCESGKLVAWVDGAATDSGLDAAHVCADGACDCPEGLHECGGKCVDLLFDEEHCGGCGLSCDPAQSCIDGECVCGLGTIDCAGECVDVSTDPLRCGGCTNACSDGEYCRQGNCECRPGLTRCDAVCIDPLADASNCGACGNICDTSSGEVCFQGDCLVGSCESFVPAYEGCGELEGSCVDPEATDRHPLHCGECDFGCQVDALCVEGECLPYYPAIACDECPCEFCETDLCCPHPGGSAVVCVFGAEECPI